MNYLEWRDATWAPLRDNWCRGLHTTPALPYVCPTGTLVFKWPQFCWTSSIQSQQSFIVGYGVPNSSKNPWVSHLLGLALAVCFCRLSHLTMYERHNSFSISGCCLLASFLLLERIISPTSSLHLAAKTEGPWQLKHAYIFIDRGSKSFLAVNHQRIPQRWGFHC